MYSLTSLAMFSGSFRLPIEEFAVSNISSNSFYFCLIREIKSDIIPKINATNMLEPVIMKPQNIIYKLIEKLLKE